MNHNLEPGNTPSLEREHRRSQRARLEEAVMYLEAALEAWREARRDIRLRALWRRFLRPGMLVLALCSITALSLGWWALGCRGSLCFSLGVLCYMMPLLATVWWLPGPPSWEAVLAEVRRSDEAVAELTEQELLLWPGPHPNEAMQPESEQRDRFAQVRTWIERRHWQLQRELEKRWESPPADGVDILRDEASPLGTHGPSEHTREQ